jgi:hypothetical protein
MHVDISHGTQLRNLARFLLLEGDIPSHYSFRHQEYIFDYLGQTFFARIQLRNHDGCAVTMGTTQWNATMLLSYQKSRHIENYLGETVEELYDPTNYPAMNFIRGIVENSPKRCPPGPDMAPPISVTVPLWFIFYGKLESAKLTGGSVGMLDRDMVTLQMNDFYREGVRRTI